MAIPVDPEPQADSAAAPAPVSAGARARRMLLRGAPLLVLAVGLGAVIATGLDDWLSLETLAAYRGELLEFVSSDYFLCVGAFLLAQTAVVAFSIPAVAIVIIAGGLLLGPLTTTALSVVAQTLGGVLLYLAAGSALRPFLTRHAGPALKRFEAGFHSDAFTYITTLRLMPLFPAWVVNLGASLLDVPLRTFALATLLGAIPSTFVFAHIGSGLGEVLDDGEIPELLELLDDDFILPLLALACLALTPALIRRWRAYRERRGGKAGTD